jgi:hypothetical protein
MIDIDIGEDWPDSGVGKKLASLEDILTCKICYDLFTIPTLLPCGHLYCALCIRKYLTDKKDEESKCPFCKASCVMKQLIVVQPFSAATQAFRDVRDPLIKMCSNQTQFVTEAPGLIFSTGSREELGIGQQQQQQQQGHRGVRQQWRSLNFLNFHLKSNGQVRSLVDEALKRAGCSKKISKEGETSDIIARHREFVIRNNAQQGIPDPMHVDEIVMEINSEAKKQAIQRFTASNHKAKVEAVMKGGKEDKGISNLFSSLIQKEKKRNDRRDGKSEATNDVTTMNQQVPAVSAAGTGSSSLGLGLGLHHGSTWRIWVSEDLDMPFYYNVRTKVGQWEKPECFESEMGSESPREFFSLLPSNCHNPKVQGDVSSSRHNSGIGTGSSSSTSSACPANVIDLDGDEQSMSMLSPNDMKLEPKTWVCKSCTLENDLDKSDCVVCFNPRNPGIISSLAVSSQSTVQSKKRSNTGGGSKNGLLKKKKKK